MSWLRLDDGFTGNPKILSLTLRERWGWLELLCHCARYKTAGLVRLRVPRELGLSRYIDRYVSEGLLEPADDAMDGWVVHDWETYNAPKDPGAAKRMRDLRQRSPRPATGRWGKTRQAVFDRDRGVCVDCGEQDEAWNADHVPDRATLEAQGLSIYDLAYIETRCQSCHSTKTRREAHERRTRGEPSTEPTSNGVVGPPARARSRPVLNTEDPTDPEPHLATPAAARRSELERLDPRAQLPVKP